VAAAPAMAVALMEHAPVTPVGLQSDCSSFVHPSVAPEKIGLNASNTNISSRFVQVIAVVMAVASMGLVCVTWTDFGLQAVSISAVPTAILDA